VFFFGGGGEDVQGYKEFKRNLKSRFWPSPNKICSCPTDPNGRSERYIFLFFGGGTNGRIDCNQKALSSPKTLALEHFTDDVSI
jgi:hypothetical protein